jgi:hypothetical protein
MQQRDIPDGYYASVAQARQEARQTKFVQPESIDEEAQKAIEDYITNTPSVKALLDDPELSEKFIKQIDMERKHDPKSSDITIINRAAELFEPVLKTRVKATEPEKTPENLAEKKMAKVVSPKASNPANNEEPDKPVIWDSANINKESQKAAEKSVREALKSMGLAD